MGKNSKMVSEAIQDEPYFLVTTGEEPRLVLYDGIERGILKIPHRFRFLTLGPLLTGDVLVLRVSGGSKIERIDERGGYFDERKQIFRDVQEVIVPEVVDGRVFHSSHYVPGFEGTLGQVDKEARGSLLMKLYDAGFFTISNGLGGHEDN